MKNHKVLRGLSILLIVASLLMLTGGWLALKKEYRREMSYAIDELEDYFDGFKALFYWTGLDRSRDYKEVMKKLDKARDKAIDIVRDGALSLTEVRYVISKAVSIMGDAKKMLKEVGNWEYNKDEFNEVYVPLTRIKTVYTLFFALTVVLSLLAGVLHLLKKKHSGIPAFICFLIWTVAAFVAADYLNNEVLYNDVLTVTAFTILAPLCMLASVILWKTGYKAYKAAEASAPAPAPAAQGAAVTPSGSTAAQSAPAAPSGRADAGQATAQCRFCPYCGRDISTVNAKFCPGCGKPLSGASGGGEAAQTDQGSAE